MQTSGLQGTSATVMVGLEYNLTALVASLFGGCTCPTPCPHPSQQVQSPWAVGRISQQSMQPFSSVSGTRPPPSIAAPESEATGSLHAVPYLGHPTGSTSPWVKLPLVLGHQRPCCAPRHKTWPCSGSDRRGSLTCQWAHATTSVLGPWSPWQWLGQEAGFLQ